MRWRLNPLAFLTQRASGYYNRAVEIGGVYLNYLLMNKDTEILSFSCSRDEFDEAECKEERWFTDSPEFGTDGYYAKCWMREEGHILLYKSGSNTFEIEPFSEYLACQVERLLHLDFVDYDLAFHHDRLISKCELSTSESIGLVKTHDVLPKGERSIASMLRFFRTIGAEEQFRRMCVFRCFDPEHRPAFGQFRSFSR